MCIPLAWRWDRRRKLQSIACKNGLLIRIVRAHITPNALTRKDSNEEANEMRGEKKNYMVFRNSISTILSQT